MTNKEKTAWLSRYRRELGRQQMLCAEVEALTAQAAQVSALLDKAAPRRAAAQLQAARRRLDVQFARCIELRRQIVWAISRLDDERAREVLLRRFIRGQTVREAAADMGVVERRVEQLQTAGVRALHVRGAARGAKRPALRKDPG